VRRFQINFAGQAALQRRRPTCDADAPLVAGFETGEVVLWPRCDEVVAVEHREVEEVLIDEHTDRMQAAVFRAGAAIAVAEEAGHRLAAAAFQFGAEDVSGHGRT
jgi:hypothetical protein